MAPKKITGYVKLQITGGKATPAPPVGPALGQAQVNIMEFCKQFNARTQNKEMAGLIIPVVITVYVDRTFTFITKTPPAAVLLKKAANLAKGSGTPNKNKVGMVTEAQVLDIAKQKTAYEMLRSDWSSDVCSSDLPYRGGQPTSSCRASRSGRQNQSSFPFESSPPTLRRRQCLRPPLRLRADDRLS